MLFWFGYNLIFAAGFLCLLPRFIFRMWKRGGYRKGFAERFGVYNPEVLTRVRARPRIWVHAVSVGEVYVALRHMAELRSREANMAFVLTVTTSTGHAVAAARMDLRDVLLYFPVDFSPVLRRVLRQLAPRALILTEGEFWPNLIRLTHDRGIPIAVINGIMSNRSFRGYGCVRPVISRVLRMLDLLVVQGQQDRERLEALGAPPDRIHVVGTAKYDVVQADPGVLHIAQRHLELAGINPGCRVLLGGSTWEGEEVALCRVYAEVRKRHPDLVLVLAPRHAERRAAVVNDVRQTGLTVALRSDEDGTVLADPPDVYVVDTTGELKHFYARATIVFVGKSLTQQGGQNILEPALEGKPVLVGPHMENFPDVTRDFLAGEALIQVRSESELADRVGMLLDDDARCSEVGRRARDLVASKAGAVSAATDLLLRSLGLARASDGKQK
jgi:3-deoxy-D-manno-octulosonic-acid transferase